MNSAVGLAPIWKVTGNVLTRLDDSGEVGTPLSVASTVPGRLINVTTVLSGLTSLMVRSPMYVCDMAVVTTMDLTVAEQPAMDFTGMLKQAMLASVPL